MDSYTINKLRQIEKELRKASKMHAGQADRIEQCIKRAQSKGGQKSYSSRKDRAKGES